MHDEENERNDTSKKCKVGTPKKINIKKCTYEKDRKNTHWKIAESKHQIWQNVKWQKINNPKNERKAVSGNSMMNARQLCLIWCLHYIWNAPLTLFVLSWTIFRQWTLYQLWPSWSKHFLFIQFRHKNVLSSPGCIYSAIFHGLHF